MMAPDSDELDRTGIVMRHSLEGLYNAVFDGECRKCSVLVTLFLCYVSSVICMHISVQL